MRRIWSRLCRKDEDWRNHRKPLAMEPFSSSGVSCSRGMGPKVETRKLYGISLLLIIELTLLVCPGCSQPGFSWRYFTCYWSGTDQPLLFTIVLWSCRGQNKFPSDSQQISESHTKSVMYCGTCVPSWKLGDLESRWIFWYGSAPLVSFPSLHWSRIPPSIRQSYRTRKVTFSFSPKI